MIIAPMDYHRADSVARAVELLDAFPDAAVIAGGQSLLVDLKLGHRHHNVLVDVAHIPELRRLEVSSTELRLGAAVSYAEVLANSAVCTDWPVLAHSIRSVGDRQVRARGTIGGAVMNADRAADVPSTLMALDAKAVVAGAAGNRTVAVAELLEMGAHRAPALPRNEVLVELRIPRSQGPMVFSYQKFRQRSHEWATAGIVAIAWGADADRVLRIAAMNLAQTSVRARTAEATYANGARTDDVVASLLADLDPPSDHKGDRGFRMELARVLAERALGEVDRGRDR